MASEASHPVTVESLRSMSVFAGLPEAALDQLGNARRHSGCNRRAPLLVTDCPHDLERVEIGKRFLSSEELTEDHPEAVDVAPIRQANARSKRL